ncbi:MAG: hypothetical protein O2968_09950 [Acidobacteria bacterium]|nr:hypothetical protein [Acidobacteriota bacterium]
MIGTSGVPIPGEMLDSTARLGQIDRSGLDWLLSRRATRQDRVR